ncbi:hypothetical protein BDP27DRAFT_1449362 [Rhodocollybia butyracea]|uniref:Uncharacterized protein n=1 Tax=Rhodocollybia butyracea TaxID=206335 RepID=A0A9P5PK28_9AGAR|nr:hypothetical protein BDP27DRAFT_1449362 [Rhodocollybia butyracea]
MHIRCSVHMERFDTLKELRCSITFIPLNKPTQIYPRRRNAPIPNASTFPSPDYFLPDLPPRCNSLQRPKPKLALRSQTWIVQLLVPTSFSPISNGRSLSHTPYYLSTLSSSHLRPSTPPTPHAHPQGLTPHQNSPPLLKPSPTYTTPPPLGTIPPFKIDFTPGTNIKYCRHVAADADCLWIWI